jgi:hypothetical protein
MAPGAGPSPGKNAAAPVRRPRRRSATTQDRVGPGALRTTAPAVKYACRRTERISARGRGILEHSIARRVGPTHVVVKPADHTPLHAYTRATRTSGRQSRRCRTDEGVPKLPTPVVETAGTARAGRACRPTDATGSKCSTTDPGEHQRGTIWVPRRRDDVVFMPRKPATARRPWEFSPGRAASSRRRERLRPSVPAGRVSAVEVGCRARAAQARGAAGHGLPSGLRSADRRVPTEYPEPEDTPPSRRRYVGQPSIFSSNAGRS